MKKNLPLIGVAVFIFLIFFSYNKYVEYKNDRANPTRNNTYSKKDLEELKKLQESNPIIDDKALIIYSQKVILNKLKSPSTADFQNIYNAKVIKGLNNTYNVKSYVDSENSFGTVIRKKYDLKLKINNNEIEVLDVSIYN